MLQFNDLNDLQIMSCERGRRVGGQGERGRQVGGQGACQSLIGRDLRTWFPTSDLIRVLMPSGSRGGWVPSADQGVGGEGSREQYECAREAEVGGGCEVEKLLGYLELAAASS